MARRKKPNIFRKIIIIGASLIAVQLGFIVYFQQQSPEKSTKDEIDLRVKGNVKGGPERREQMRIQLSVEDYRLKYGKLPKTLNELVPEYFDSVPRDPTTSKPFAYTIEGTRYFVGERSGTTTAQISIPSGLASGTPNEQEQKALLASLDNPEANTFVYDSTGKRDPFRPFEISKRNDVDCNQFPLACYDIGELRLASVLTGMDNPIATVQNSVGKGFMVRKGTKIGRNGGEVVEILPDKIMILELLTDITGQIKENVIALELRGQPGGPTTGAANARDAKARKPR